MVDLHNSLDVFFNHLGNTGSMPDKTLMKLMTLSLINDYKDEMVACNPSWKRTLEDIESSFMGTSCLFKIV